MADGCCNPSRRALAHSDSESELSTDVGSNLFMKEVESGNGDIHSPSSRTHGGGKAGHRARVRSRSDVKQVMIGLEGAAVYEQPEAEAPASPTAATEVPEVADCLDSVHPRLLPAGLVVALLLGGACLLLLQCPLLGKQGAPLLGIRMGVGAVYAAALGLIAFAGTTDPGMVPEELDDPEAPIQRSYKSSQFPRRIRRYDHYCRWLCNSIGLYNHRAFFTLLLVLTVIVVGGAAMDVWLLATVFRGESWVVRLLLTVHLLHLAVFGYNLKPILQLHMAFVSRNELAAEWKEDLHYVVDLETGESVHVSELDVDTFNDKFDSFRYDPSRNPWDQGCLANCTAFWCTPRWPADQMGEF